MIQNYKKNKSVQIYNRIFLLFHSFLPFIPIPGTFFHAKKHTLFLFPFPANSSLTIPHFGSFAKCTGWKRQFYLYCKDFKKTVPEKYTYLVPKVQHSYTHRIT